MKQDLNVIVTVDFSDEQKALLRSVSDKVHLHFLPVQDPEQIPDERWHKVDVLYTQNVLPDPEDVPHLKWVQLNSAGVDVLLTHPIFDKNDVLFTSMSGVMASQVAEYVLMAILAMGQKLPKIMQHQRGHQWPERGEVWQGLLPIELRHSTVGILGYGSIGRQVARLLKPFGTTILAAKKDVMHPEDQGYIREGMGDPHGEMFDRLYPIAALKPMLKECDFVVLALPLTDATRHILDESAFEIMKPSAHVINVGRGGLIDQEALMDALTSKKIAGAVLDVFEEEPLPVESPLWDMPNVIISPHIAGYGSHLKADLLSFFKENLNRFLSDLPLYNLIDLDSGY